LFGKELTALFGIKVRLFTQQDSNPCERFETLRRLKLYLKLTSFDFLQTRFPKFCVHTREQRRGNTGPRT